jgi:biopolymer transport protein ExbD
MWKVRHQGSPTAMSDLTLAQVVDGLVEGRWEPTDEVMGPNDTAWVPIEMHPQLAEIAAELEPPPPRHYDDETHLDMNALIDVCLVLLIFFILTTSYAVLQKRLEAPGVSAEKVKGPPVITKAKIDQQMIFVTVHMEDGKPVLRIEDRVVDLNRLEYELYQYRRATKKTQLLLLLDDDVPHRINIAVQDAAKGADLQGVSLALPDKKKP